MRKAFLILFLTATLILTACGGSEDVPQADTAVNREDISCYLTSRGNLNPLCADTENDIAVFSLMYDSLIYLDKDMTIIPQLAKNCTVSSDCRSISFVLRDDVFWHDGEKFTSEDVKYTFDFIKNQESSSMYYNALSNVDEITVTDDYNFTMTLWYPNARIVNLLDFPIIPAHRSDVYKSPVGTGRYMVEEVAPGDRIVLTKNNLWTLGELPIEEKINVRLLGNSTDEFSLFRTGEIDVLNINAAQMSQFGFADISKYVQYCTTKYEFIGFNLSNKVFADPSVRKAFSKAINRSEIADETYLGMATPVNAPIIPSAYYYNSEADNLAFSLDEAKQILTSAGWVDNGGVMQKSIDDVLYTLQATILVNKENAQRVAAAEKISKMLSLAGFKVAVNAVDWETYEDRIYNDEYSLFIGGIEFMPNFDYSFFLSSGAADDGQNYMNYSSSDMDNAISKIKQAVSMEECKNAYLEFQYIFTRDLPVCGIVFQNNCLVYQADINDVTEASFSKPLKNFNRWHREK